MLVGKTDATVQQLDLNDFKCRLVAGSFPAVEYQDLSATFASLQFVQADPIRAPARAQDLILRQRVDGYLAGQLETSFPHLSLEEGFLFAYGFMLPHVWCNIIRGRQTFQPNKHKLTKLDKKILQAVSHKGEVQSKDLDDEFGKHSGENAWGQTSKSTKLALDRLHDCGFLRVSRREKGTRVYQVPPPMTHDDTSDTMTSSSSTQAERFSHMVMTTARVFGPTSRRFLLSELKNLGQRLLPSRKDRDEVITQLIASEHLEEVQVEGVSYIWIAEEWKKKAVPERVRILSPFDPLVRDRVRFEQVWGWEYKFEAYTPVEKRKRGYYAMPLLWCTDVIGWANAKIEDGVLNVQFGYVKTQPRAKAFRILAEAEVEQMAVFLGLDKGAWKLKL